MPDTKATFKVTDRFSGWEEYEDRVVGRIKLPPGMGWWNTRMTLSKAREIAEEHGVELEVKGV